MHLGTVQSSSLVTVELVIQVFRQAGFHVMLSFDLQVAKPDPSLYTCPYHGGNSCDCQLIILLVYKQDHQPFTLVLQGKDGNLHIDLQDDPDRISPSGIEEMIWRVIR
jgi:hypothetical protein